MSDPIPFKEANFTYTAPQSMPDCMELPVFKNDDQIISKWKFTTDELEEIARTGCVFLHVYGSDQPPVALSAHEPFHQAEASEG